MRSSPLALAVGDGPTLPAHGVQDVFVARLSGDDGSPLWAIPACGPLELRARAIAVGGAGAREAGGSAKRYVTGYFRGILDMGNEPLVALGETDVFLAKLAP